MDKSQKHNVKKRKLQKNMYAQYDAIYIKFKNMQNNIYCLWMHTYVVKV